MPQETLRPGVTQRMDTRAARLHPTDREIEREEIEIYTNVASITALAGYVSADKFHKDYRITYGQAPTDSVTKGWKNLIDGASVLAMEDALRSIRRRTVISVCEGPKDEAPHLRGSYGKDGDHEKHAAVDPIDGTTNLSKFGKRIGEPAITVIALTNKDGLRETPEGLHYQVKLVGPAELNYEHRISLDRPYAENLDLILRTLNIRPDRLTQVTLNPESRPVNQEFVDAARNRGVNLRIIDSGDVLPGVLAGVPVSNGAKERTILVTRGGGPETKATAVGIKALGGFMQAMDYDKDRGTHKGNRVLTLDDLVPERDPMAMKLFLTGILNDSEYLGLPGIQELGDGTFRTVTFVIDRNGVNSHERFFRNEKSDMHPNGKHVILNPVL